MSEKKHPYYVSPIFVVGGTKTFKTLCSSMVIDPMKEVEETDEWDS